MTQYKLDVLCKEEGLDFDSVGDLMIDSVNPGICMNEDCNFICEVEPDQHYGWCENCETGTVKSLSELIIEGFKPPE